MVDCIPLQIEKPWEFMGKGLDFGLGLSRLHTMPGQSLHLLYFIGYFLPIYLDSPQSWATQLGRPLCEAALRLHRAWELLAMSNGIFGHCQVQLLVHVMIFQFSFN